MGDLVVRAIVAADRERIEQVLVDSWGGTSVVAHGVVYNAATLPGLVAERDGTLAGLLTYDITYDITDDIADDTTGAGLEIVTIDALARHTGVGTALLAAAVEIARASGLSRVWLVTTNDNLDALRFYQRRGLRIAAIGHGAVDAARALKPAIPAVGAYGIELHDELTLELRLA